MLQLASEYQHNWQTYTAIIGLSYLLVVIFYNAFKTRWPELYFSQSDYTSLFISVSPVRYISFRLIPILVILTLVLSVFGSSLSQEQLNYLGLLIGFLIGITSNGVAVVKLMLNSGTIHTFFNKPFQILVHLFSILAVAITGYLAGVISKNSYIANITPSPQGLVDNIWSSLITAVIAVYLYKIYQGRSTSTEDVLDKSYRQLSPEIINYINSYSATKNANKNLVLSICIVENIQRPKWVRELEKMKSTAFRKGSYGIMQVQSERFLDDERSITKAIDLYFANTSNLANEGELRELVKKYNDSEKYIDLVFNAYYFLTPQLG